MVSPFSTRAGSVVNNYVVAAGEQILTTTTFGVNSSGYATTQGTSYSSPLAAGVVALIRQARPNATAAQVVQAILETADPSGLAT
jgi:subtilisin family serine protease